MTEATEHEGGEHALTIRRCRVCDTSFSPRRKNQVQCSKACNVAWNNNQRSPFGPGRKRCASCLKIKDFKSDFVRLDPLCRECAALKEAGQKRCTRCYKIKTASGFYERSSRNGLSSICKECVSAKNRQRNAQTHIKQRARARKFQERYGIAIEEYEHRLVVQGGLCAICREPSEKTLHVDHSHRTGVVRALLCLTCNALLGHCREDVQRLRAAIAYIERFEHHASDLQS